VRVVVVAPGDTVELTRSPGARIGLVVVGQGGVRAEGGHALALPTGTCFLIAANAQTTFTADQDTLTVYVAGCHPCAFE